MNSPIAPTELMAIAQKFDLELRNAEGDMTIPLDKKRGVVDSLKNKMTEHLEDFQKDYEALVRRYASTMDSSADAGRNKLNEMRRAA